MNRGLIIHIPKQNLFVFILLVYGLSVANMKNLWGVLVPWYIKYMIAIVIVLYTVFLYIKRGHTKIEDDIIKNMTLAMLIPYIAIAIYELKFVLFTSFDFTYITRSYATIFEESLQLVMAAAIVYLFKKNAVIYVYHMLGISYLLTIVMTISTYGINEFWVSFIEHESEASIMLEVSDVTFALGFYFLYFLLLSKRDVKYRITNLLIIGAFLLLGYKRIAMLGIAIAIFFYIAMLKKTRKLNKVIYILGIGIIVSSYLYIYSINSGLLDTYLLHQDINTMGRTSIYNFFRPYYQFGAGYWGIGFASTGKLLEETTIKGLALGVHNDILKYYIEIGFLPQLLRLIYLFICVPRIFLKKYGRNFCILELSLLVYAFCTYLTDNTTGYFCFQVSFLVILISYAINLKEHRKDTEITKELAYV